MSDGVIRPIQRKENMSNLVAREIIDLILSGHYKPGQRLPTEKEFAEQLGVGRNTLREAIRALSILGFVDVRVPEGMFVAKTSDNFFMRKMQLSSASTGHDAQALTEARTYIECITARLAAQKATQSDKQALRELVILHEKAADDNQQREYDAQFHVMLADIAGNPFIRQMLLMLIDGIYDWIENVLRSTPSVKAASCQQHREILAHIESSDPEGTERAMRTHMAYVANLYIQLKTKCASETHVSEENTAAT